MGITMKFIVIMYHDKSYINSQLHTIILETVDTWHLRTRCYMPLKTHWEIKTTFWEIFFHFMWVNISRFLWCLGQCLPTCHTLYWCMCQFTRPSINYPHCYDHKNNLTHENPSTTSISKFSEHINPRTSICFVTRCGRLAVSKSSCHDIILFYFDIFHVLRINCNKLDLKVHRFTI